MQSDDYLRAISEQVKEIRARKPGGYPRWPAALKEKIREALVRGVSLKVLKQETGISHETLRQCGRRKSFRRVLIRQEPRDLEIHFPSGVFIRGVGSDWVEKFLSDRNLV